MRKKPDRYTTVLVAKDGQPTAEVIDCKTGKVVDLDDIEITGEEFCRLMTTPGNMALLFIEIGKKIQTGEIKL